MSDKPFTEKQILTFLKTHYAIEASSAQFLSLGADMNAFICKVNAEPNSYFLKIKSNHHVKIHMSVVCFLHDYGIKEIIFPITAIDGQLFKQLNHFQIIVYPFVDGKNGFEQFLTKNQWIKLGNTLKKIHTLNVPFGIKKQIKKEKFSPCWRKIAMSLDSLIEGNASSNKITGDFKKFYNANFNTIHRLADSAEKLCKEICQDSNDYVLCHSDIHAGNILITSDFEFNRNLIDCLRS